MNLKGLLDSDGDNKVTVLETNEFFTNHWTDLNNGKVWLAHTTI